MKMARSNSSAIGSLSLGLVLILAGCATVSYAPTQDNVPKMSYQEASQKLMAIKNSSVYTAQGYCRIDDVNVGSDITGGNSRTNGKNGAISIRYLE